MISFYDKSSLIEYSNFKNRFMTLKQICKDICPPILWRVAHKIKKALPIASIHVIRKNLTARLAASDSLNEMVNIEIANSHHIEGWAWIPNHLDEKFKVYLMGASDEILFSTVADIYRDDLFVSGMGDGAYGFRIKGNFSSFVRKIVFQSSETKRIIPIDVGRKRNNEFIAIHHDDFIFKFCENNPLFTNDLALAVDYYINDAKDAAQKLKQLCANYFPKQDKLSLLEFAAGYGRVTRHICKERFCVTACDIHEDAVSYMHDNIRVKAMQSTPLPEDFPSDIKYDVVFALSFFSHMPDKTFGRWISALFRQVIPGGILIFTTHGKISNENFLMLASKDQDFIFLPSSEQDDLQNTEYGTTVSLYSYVDRICRDFIDAAPTEYHEGFWWTHQDVYVIKKTAVLQSEKLVPAS